MIGLDTNMVLRYLLQDDPAHTPQVNHIFERQLSTENPGFVNLAVVLEDYIQLPLLNVWAYCKGRGKARRDCKNT